MEKIEQYFTEDDYAAMDRAKTFGELVVIAKAVLMRIPKPVVMVCGPMTSGGTKNIELNFKIFAVYINFLRENGFNVFTQLPFEKAMWRIMETPEYRDGDQLLEEFYGEIFKSGLIEELHFIPNWETSHGATWEHKKAEELGIKIIYF